MYIDHYLYTLTYTIYHSTAHTCMQILSGNKWLDFLTCTSICITNCYTGTSSLHVLHQQVLFLQGEGKVCIVWYLSKSASSKSIIVQTSLFSNYPHLSHTHTHTHTHTLLLVLCTPKKYILASHKICRAL